MARRSATNARYQKYQEPAGQTRKSAASAKPKRSSGSATPAKSTAKKSAKRSPIAVEPATAEFKAVRRTWWILLGVALVLTTASWAIRAYVQTSWSAQVATGVLGLAYGSIFYALFLDWTKMRPMRKAAFQAAKSGKSAKRVAEKPSSDKVMKAEPGSESKTSSDTTSK